MLKKGHEIMSYLKGYNKDFCENCNKKRTPEGHDGCLGKIENVMNACCGHGETGCAYVQFDHEKYKENPNKYTISGEAAIVFFDFILKEKN